MVQLRFNAWGEKYAPYDDDARLPARLAAVAGMRRYESQLVMEGGGFTVDGEGTLITTEQCLLNPNRNPGWSREQIEETLRQALGVEVIIWLPYGLAEDSVTDGHVDGVCAFVRPGAVLLQTVTDRSDPNWDRLDANRRVLQRSRDAAGRQLEILEMPYLGHAEVGGRRVRVPSVNFYVANGGVVAPTAGMPTDDAMLGRIADAFPDREVVPVPARVIGFGGGGVHCITQQVPVATRTGS
jgi:agmatine deiminase